MKAAEIARLRMRSSRLTGDRFRRAEEAVAWHLAMQAQDYGPAKWSIGQRSTGVSEADLDEAVASGAIVRTHVLRPTWHFVAREDLRWLLALSGPRVQQGNAGRYRELGLDARARARAEKLIVSALEGGGRLTRNQIGEALDSAGFDRSGQRMPYVLMHCELEAVIGSGGLAGKQQTYALLDGRVPEGPRLDRDEALVELTRRYLTSHGPASVKDLRWWSGLTMADLRKALHLLGPEVTEEAIEDVTFWRLAADGAPPRPSGTAHLLQTYDELVVGYTESRFFADPNAEIARRAWSGRTFPSGAVIVGGRILGHWRRAIERERIRVEVHLYEEPTPSHTRAVARATAALGRFVGRQVELETTRLDL